MREYEYMAWDQKNKRMWEVTEIKWEDGKVVYIRGTTDYFGKKDQPIGAHKDFAEIDDIVLRQFTGLLDKNGKEIYEGDILSTAKCGPVVWEEDCYLCGGKYQMYLSSEARYGEVIGNIYETPELLKEN